MTTKEQFERIKFVLRCYRSMGGLSADELVEAAEKLINEPDFLAEELKATNWSDNYGT